jgi:hypothetical protein
MWTRNKKKQQDRRQAQLLCWNFTIDVNIYDAGCVFKPKWDRSKKKAARDRRRRKEHELLLRERIRDNIERKISKYHGYGDLEVRIDGVPKYFWRGLTKHWEDYIPQRRRKGFEEYKKTHRSAVFVRSFSRVRLTKTVGVDQIMKITIGRRAAARAIYNCWDSRMVLTFWYEPFPFPLGWIPSYRGNSNKGRNCKHKTYFLERNE